MAVESDRRRREIERLHDAVVVQLDGRTMPRGSERASGAGRSEIDVDAAVASTISIVRQVASALIDLQETSRRQEEMLYDQRQAIADLQHQKQAAYGELAEAERAVQAERERADRAESRLLSIEAQHRRLEDYCAALRSHLNSLMSVVHDSLAVGGGASGGAVEDHLS